MLDPNWALDSTGTWYDMADPSQFCNPGPTGIPGIGTPAPTGNLIPGVSNGLLLGVAVAGLIMLEVIK